MPPGPRPPSLAPLLDKARRTAGGRDWEDRSFLPALELLVSSCAATARLNPQGARVLDSVVVRHLVNRLLVEAEVASRPAAAAPVGRAVVVTGLPRTGTTALHNLLALDPASRALRLWEALRPVPPRPEEGATEDELVRRAATWLDRLYEVVPGFRSIHPASAEGPEECDALLQNEFASQHFDDMFDAVAYSEWLASAPLRHQYGSYARQLGVLRRPQDEDRPWVLKSPSHLGHLDALLDACPEATIVLCHRHPAEAVPSYASLVHCLRRAYSDDVSRGAVGRQALHRCAKAMARALDVRSREPHRFVDIAYAGLVRDPLATVAHLYERLGWALAPDVHASMREWLARHPRHEHGVHRYTMEEFALTRPAIAGAFERYLEDCSPSLG